MFSLNEMIQESNKHNIKGIKNLVNIYLNTSRRSLFLYRIAKLMYDKNYTLIATLLKNKLIRSYGLHISLKAHIGKGVEFRHPNGIVIGDGVTIGENVVIYQQVTLGGKNEGDAKKNHYPFIGHEVTIYAGAKILGDIKIGNKSVIGANSVVLKEVPEGYVAAGIPAKNIRRSS
ncbi:serine acetyltransferase [Salipaludibacillus sp. LMS25]|uniref:serine O-acetyltransferase EpsC n=1 Tax=Salipaludibacillus sp. LMS25 TaxID=2924031 RepID=UPI0020D048E7|nr:serine O-acetyltransferase EpsC [Salipaludibacillus sp. LMS25]UTR16170.1 serine acetyltransferase [Salipaludibacillus sp. LMS25]